jgi:hypothetical protein
MIASKLSRSQPCRTLFVLRVAGRRHTRPVAGSNKVKILLVPRRTYSCGKRAGASRGCQLLPGYGTVWNGPASSSHQTARPSDVPSV